MFAAVFDYGGAALVGAAAVWLVYSLCVRDTPLPDAVMNEPHGDLPNTRELEHHE